MKSVCCCCLFVPLFLPFSVQFSLKNFITLFSGTVRHTKLKLGTHMDNGLMYCVYRNPVAASYLSLYFTFLFLLLPDIEIFVTFFSGTESWNLIQTWMIGQCVVYTGIRLLILIYPFISFFCLSNFQLLICLSSQRYSGVIVRSSDSSRSFIRPTGLDKGV